MNKEQMYNTLLEMDFSIMEIASMTKDEMFSHILNWEGIQGYSTWIKDLVSAVYDMEVK